MNRTERAVQGRTSRASWVTSSTKRPNRVQHEAGSRRLAVVASLVSALALAGCAAQQPQTKKGDAAGEPKLERIALSNVSHFDLAACGPRGLALPAEATAEVLVGALLSAQPSFQECLVDPKARGPAERTDLTVKALASDADVRFEVAGSNLSPLGRACVEAAARRLPLVPLPKGAKAVEGLATFVHVVGSSPSVRFGANTASDLVGAVRLALPLWCSCYEPLRSAPPPSLKATLKVSPTAPLEVAFDGALEEPAKGLAACLKAKLEALELPKPSQVLQVPYAFAMVDAYAATESPGVFPPLRFTQLDAIRNQRNADVAVSLGARALKATAYDAVVQRYKAKPQPSLIKELREKCAAVLEADDRWLASLGGLRATSERQVSVASELAASEPAWNQALGAARQALARVVEDVGAAEAQKQRDAQACPKSR